MYGPVPSTVDSLVFTLKYPYTLAYNQVPALEDLRLFSAGGGSELVEWDLTSGTVLVSFFSIFYTLLYDELLPLVANLKLSRRSNLVYVGKPSKHSSRSGL